MRKAILNKKNLKHNLEIIRKQYNNINIIGVVKADAYGHGAREISKWLFDLGVKTVAVATLDEAKEVLKNDLNQDVLILGPSDDNELIKLADTRIIQTVFSEEYYNQIKYVKVRKHINTNTGMNRLGINYDDEIIDDFKKDEDVEAFYTHFLNNKDFEITKKQLDTFSDVKENFKYHTGITSLSLLEEYNIKNIRVGLSLYGYEDFDWSNKLKPVMSLYGKIISVKKIRKDESISYNARYIADKDMNVATVSIGYADGLPWNYKNGYVYYLEEKCKILGQITMDYIMIDVTNISAQLNDYVEIFGDNISLKEVANKSDTIIYEVLTKIGNRVRKEYI